MRRLHFLFLICPLITFFSHAVTQISERENRLERFIASIRILFSSHSQCWKTGDTFCSKKKYYLAIRFYSEAIRAHPEEKYYRSRAACYIEMGKVDSAISDLKRAVSLGKNKENQQSRVLLCETLYNSGKFADAIDETYFLGASELVKLGDKLCSHQKFGEAIRSYTQAINVNPTRENYKSRGLCYIKMSTLDKALSDFEDAARVDESLPKHKKKGHGRVLFIQALFDYRKFEEAAAEMHALPVDQLVTLADEFLEKEDTQKALDCLTAAIEKNPENAACYEKRGSCYRKKKDWVNAISDFERTVLIDPSRVNSWIDLSETLFAVGRYDDAKKALESLDPDATIMRDDEMMRLERIRVKIAMEIESTTRETSLRTELPVENNTTKERGLEPDELESENKKEVTLRTEDRDSENTKDAALNNEQQESENTKDEIALKMEDQELENKEGLTLKIEKQEV